jgi:broad specificity phosphatase PhoE
MDEQDERFMPDEHESPQSCFDRVTQAFDEIWKEQDTYVSLTAHAGIMRVACKFFVSLLVVGWPC